MKLEKGSEPVRAEAFISTVPATRRERRVAAAALAASLVGFCIIAPYAKLQLSAVPAFIPLNQAAFFINDLITAILLLAQVPHVRSRALVVLACGYIFDALMLIPHTLTYPGVFSPTGLLGAGDQSTAWIYMFWHGGFPLFVIAYATLRHAPERDSIPVFFWRSLIRNLAGVALLVFALATLATAGKRWLPPLLVNNEYTSYQRITISVIWLFSITAAGFLYRRRRSSALDLWLTVVMCAWVFDVALAAVVNHGRFDLGFYAGRAYGLIAASFVLIMLLVESSYLYARIQRSQELLAQAQKMEAVGQLTGGIAHDFNNLLAVIQGGIELVERQPGPVGHEKLTRFLGPAKRAVENGTALTRSLLAFARRVELAPREVDSNQLVGAVAELLKQTLGAGIRVETDLSPSASRCMVDPNQLEVALLNLAVNARDAMPDGGTLTIRTENLDLDLDGTAGVGVPVGNYVIISIIDTGTGMSSETLQRAFEPFFTTKAPGKGTGLGLSQVYGFVSQSGGHVRVLSRLGEGTTVKIFLPALSEDKRINRIKGLGGSARTQFPATDQPRIAEVATLIIGDEIRPSGSLGNTVWPCGKASC